MPCHPLCRVRVGREHRRLHQGEQAEAVVEHHIITGHAIGDVRAAGEDPATGWTDEWPPPGED